MAGKFRKLTNNESSFPHVDNVNVYQFDNGFDYQRYDYTQMELQICTVPWDVGEAHVGQRTISGIGNVVYFGSKEKRDEWFAQIPDSECFRFSTKFKELHREQVIDVPIPYDVCARHNYLVVRYNMFANDSSPVEFEDENGKRDWFWFIREVEFKAPNTTRLHLLDDAFQTWIYDVNVTSMILERGHAPMFSTPAGKFLENPIANNANLLTEDVNYGGTSIVKHTDSLVLNSGDMLACVATTANPRADFGTKADNDWRTPASPYYTNGGVPSVYVLGMEPSELDTFLTNITAQVPQFKQTVQGVFFASRQLVNAGSGFTFGGVTCYPLTADRVKLDLTELAKAQFGYPTRYADMAKLYTYPYAHIEVTDENGDVSVVRIEDTTGELDVSASMSLAYPFVTVHTHLLGAGGANRATVRFRNVTERTFDIGGKWYETLHEWNVPTFAVVLDAAREYDYSTHFDRAQAVVDYTNAYSSAMASATTARDNAKASATTARANAYASADAGKANADNEADTLVANTALQTNANGSITTRSNQAAYDDAGLSNLLAQALQAWESGYSRDNVNAQQDAQYATAAIGAGSGVLQGAISGASMGPAGIVGGLVAGAISGATSMAQTAVAANLTATQAENAIGLSQQKVDETSTNNIDRTNNQNSANTANTRTANNASTGAAANSAATTKENATRTRDTEKANADRDYSTANANADRSYSTDAANAGRTRDTAQQAIANGIRQAALRSPFVFGNFANGETAVSKPMALFANIVTQSDSSIAKAGDEFARYGYMLDGQWDFDGEWNIGKYFTYWKLRDFWVEGLNVPDLYMDKLRFFLFGGVTVWRSPEYIGRVNMYDNF